MEADADLLDGLWEPRSRGLWDRNELGVDT
jgi:hypothetical protein